MSLVTWISCVISGALDLDKIDLVVSLMQSGLQIGLMNSSCTVVVVAILCMTLLFRALGNATPHFKSFSEGRAAAYSIFELIHRVPPIDADDVSGRTLEKVEGNLELRNVDFTYPSRTDAPIFQNFSLRIPAGKVFFRGGFKFLCFLQFSSRQID
jgi:ABC-type multidrug transport system fused ATPase/permease subunit